MRPLRFLQRANRHPFEEAQVFAALTGGETGKYSIEQLAARIAKSASYVAKRLKLLDLTEPAAEAFRAGRIGIEHALHIAKLAPDVQENALARCFDGYFAGNDNERSLVPVSRCWIEQNVYLNLKSVPFSREDETLVPKAESCTNCQKRTGFNTLLFPEAGADACVDAACFNRKLNTSIAARLKKMPELVVIQKAMPATARRRFFPVATTVEVVAKKGKRAKEARPQERLCTHLRPAIDADGIDKGRLVKVRRQNVHSTFSRTARGGMAAASLESGTGCRETQTERDTRLPYRLFFEVLKQVKPQLTGERLVFCGSCSALCRTNWRVVLQ
jgi:ParB family chromosome partitioning protein